MIRRDATTALLVLGLLLAGCSGPGDTQTNSRTTSPATVQATAPSLESASSTGPPPTFRTEAFADLTERRVPAELSATLQAALAGAADGYMG